MDWIGLVLKMGDPSRLCLHQAHRGPVRSFFSRTPAASDCSLNDSQTRGPRRREHEHFLASDLSLRRTNDIWWAGRGDPCAYIVVYVQPHQQLRKQIHT